MRRRMRSVRLAALGFLVVAATSGAGAKQCGDDVPCDCGDVLVASRRLSGADSITTHPCPGVGLVVDVPAGRPAATLDLAGAIVSGTGRGAGIQVLGGGDGGLTIAGPGEVRGFGTGVLAPGHGLARVVDVLARDNQRDGFDLGGAGYAVTNCEASGNGRDGFRLRGTGIRLEGSRATDNDRQGFRIVGRQVATPALLSEATGNRAADFTVRAPRRHRGR